MGRRVTSQRPSNILWVATPLGPRTAGLEVQAEPKIVETLLGAVEEATKKPRRPNVDEHGPYAEKIIASKPIAYWRLNEMEGQIAHSAVRPAIDAALSNGFAWYLPGVGSGSGIGSEESLAKSNFSGPKQINRALHLAGGSINANIKGIGESYSIALWFWLAEASGASDRTGNCFVDLTTSPWSSSRDATIKYNFRFTAQARKVYIAPTSGI